MSYQGGRLNYSPFWEHTVLVFGVILSLSLENKTIPLENI